MSPSLHHDESERLPRLTVDEVRISDQARAMLDGKGCDEYRRLGNAETGKHRAIDDTDAFTVSDEHASNRFVIDWTMDPKPATTLPDCIPACSLNEHDPAMFRDSPVVTHGGSHAQLSTGARNSLILAAACVVAGLGFGVVYLVIVSWAAISAGLHNLSSW